MMTEWQKDRMTDRLKTVYPPKGITMMGWSPWCYIPSFVEICLLAPEKISDRFLPYRGMAAILIMWPASCHQIFISLYLKAFIQSLVQIGTVVSEKIQFEFLYVHELGPRSRNDLDLQYSHVFIYSIRCQLLLTFRSLAAIVSEKSTVFPFSYRKSWVTKGGCALSPFFGPPRKPKIKSYFKTLSLDCLIRWMIQVFLFHIDLTLPVAMVTENGRQNRLK